MKKRFNEKRKISSERRRLVEELHVPARRNFPQRHVIVRGYDDLWQADIVEMRLYSGFNRGHHYILTVIDVLSKYAWAVPLKSKGGSETADAIVKLIRASGRCLKNLQTDIGKEFYNVDVQKILKKHDVNHYFMYSTLKASSGSIARSKTTCGRCLHLTTITSGSTSCRISCQITTRANIGLLACDLLT